MEQSEVIVLLDQIDNSVLSLKKLVDLAFSGLTLTQGKYTFDLSADSVAQIVDDYNSEIQNIQTSVSGLPDLNTISTKAITPPINPPIQVKP